MCLIWLEWPEFFRGARGVIREYAPTDKHSWRYVCGPRIALVSAEEARGQGDFAEAGYMRISSEIAAVKFWRRDSR